jgi:hypothetical protein
VLVVRNTLQYIASFGLQLNRVPVGSVTITLDPSGAQALALIANHEAASNPHTQYATTASLSAHTGGADPHTQYALKSGAAFTGGVSAPGFTGPLTGNATTAGNAQTNGFYTAGTGAAGTENQLGALCSGYNSAYIYNNSSGWGLFSSSGGQVVNYSRASGKATFNGEATALQNTADYTIKQTLSFYNAGTGNGRIQSNDASWGMVYRPSINGANTSHLWTDASGTGIAFLTPAGNLSVNGTFTASAAISGTSFSGAGTGLTGTAASLSIGGTAAVATSLNSTLNYSIKDTLFFFNGGVGAGRIIANDATYGMAYRPSVNGSTFIHAWANDAGSVVANLTTGGLFSTPSLFLSGSNSSPSNPANYTLRTANGYGGGWSMTDSGYGLGIYSATGVMTFALGSSTSITPMASLSSVSGGTFSCGYLQGNHTGTIDSATTGTTQSVGDNSTKMATTAFVQANKTIKAWVNFNGSSGSVNASAGVSSVTRISAGQYRVNLSTTQPDTNYAVVSCTNTFKSVATHELARTTSYYTITTFDANNGSTGDPGQVYSMLAGN